jgi:hypothetical protein
MKSLVTRKQKKVSMTAREKEEERKLEKKLRRTNACMHYNVYRGTAYRTRRTERSARLPIQGRDEHEELEPSDEGKSSRVCYHGRLFGVCVSDRRMFSK